MGIRKKSKALLSVCAEQLEIFSHLIFEVEGKGWFAEREIYLLQDSRKQRLFLLSGEFTFAEVVLAIFFISFFLWEK